MPAPLALVGLGSLVTTAISGIISFITHSLAAVLSHVFGLAFISAIIFVGMHIFVSSQIDASAWAIENITALLGGDNSGLTYTFELGAIVDALRIVDCVFVIFNAYFTGLLIYLVKQAMGVQRTFAGAAT